MAKIEVKVCDLCHYEIRSDKPNKHWSDSIGKGVISFKDVAGSQCVPFDGEICMNCASALAKKIQPLLEERRKLRPQ